MLLNYGVKFEMFDDSTEECSLNARLKLVVDSYLPMHI